MLKFAGLLLTGFFLISCQMQSKESKAFEERKKEVKESIRKTSIDFGLSPLVDKILPNSDIEVRFYCFGNSYIAPVYKDLRIKTSVLILKRTNSEWSANVIRDTYGLKEKRISEQLNPISNWENLFQKLSKEEILTVSSDQNEGIYPDATFYLIETNIDQKYNLAFSSVPNEVAEEKGAKQIAKLFNLVAKEFKASDFQASEKKFQ